MRLAPFEAGAVFAAAWGTFLLHGARRPSGWMEAPAGALLVSLCTVMALYYSDGYDLRIAPSFARFVPRLLRSAGLALLLLAPARLLLPPTSRGEVLVASSLAGLGLVAALRASAYRLMRSRRYRRRVLVLGTGPLAQDLVAQIEARPHLRYDVVGMLEDGPEASPSRSRGRLEDLERVVEEIRPDRIIVAVTSRRGRLPARLLLDLELRGVVVEDGPEVYESLTGKIDFESLTPSGLMFSRDFRKSRWHAAVGRAGSLMVSVGGLAVLGPLLALIALAIRLDSRGPVLFVQDRVGLGGRRFKLIKFRTMHPARTHASEWVRDNDHRITRLGRWLRRFRLDELPQLVNVLRGDMHLVGPRPHPVCNLAPFVVLLRNAPECGEQVPCYSLRSTVRPGITGWAQVRYRYANDLEEEIEKMRYDLYYLKHRSPWLDLRILLDTVKIVLLGREQAAAEGEEAKLGREMARPHPPARFEGGRP